MSHKNFRVTKEELVGGQRVAVEWRVFGFNTSKIEDMAKARTILQLSESLTAANHLTTSLNSLSFVSSMLSKQNRQAQFLSKDIELFREKLHSDYLDLLADPVFISELLNLRDGCSIPDNSPNKSTVV